VLTRHHTVLRATLGSCTTRISHAFTPQLHSIAVLWPRGYKAELVKPHTEVVCLPKTVTHLSTILTRPGVQQLHWSPNQRATYQVYEWTPDKSSTWPDTVAHCK